MPSNVIRKAQRGSIRDAFKNEEGAIDLASIMVGIIVIGIIGGVIGATVFAVIPWAQDESAKQALDSVTTAQSAYRGFAVDSDTSARRYGTADELYNFTTTDSDTKGLLQQNENNPDYIRILAGQEVSCFIATSESETGNLFYITDKTTKPLLYTGNEGQAVTDTEYCGDITTLLTNPDNGAGSTLAFYDTIVFGNDYVVSPYKLLGGTTNVWSAEQTAWIQARLTPANLSPTNFNEPSNTYYQIPLTANQINNAGEIVNTTDNAFLLVRVDTASGTWGNLQYVIDKTGWVKPNGLTELRAKGVVFTYGYAAE